MSTPLITPERAAELLELAADRLETGQYLWGRGEYRCENLYSGHVTMCAVGALCEVTDENWEEPHYRASVLASYVYPHIVKKVLNFHAFSDLSSQKLLEQAPPENILITFNDQVAEQVGDVVEAFKLAAKDLRNQV
jgi:hypothetical protein